MGETEEKPEKTESSSKMWGGQDGSGTEFYGGSFPQLSFPLKNSAAPASSKWMGPPALKHDVNTREQPVANVHELFCMG